MFRSIQTCFEKKTYIVKIKVKEWSVTWNIFQWLLLRHAANLPEIQHCSCSRPALSLKHLVWRNKSRKFYTDLTSNAHPPLLLVQDFLSSHVSFKQSILVLQTASLCSSTAGVANSDPPDPMLCWPDWNLTTVEASASQRATERAWSFCLAWETPCHSFM